MNTRGYAHPSTSSGFAHVVAAVTISVIAVLMVVVAVYWDMNREEAANTNISVNTNSSSRETLTVADAIERASELHGQLLCLTGPYDTSFEFTAMGPGRMENGTLSRPYVWTELDQGRHPSITCDETDMGQEHCSGDITVCGMFSAGGSYGHVGAYAYQLVEVNTDVSVNTNGTTNTNVEVNATTDETLESRTSIFLRSVTTSCTTDEECTLARSDMDYATCCQSPSCFQDFVGDEWVSVNETSFSTYVQEVQAQINCDSADCPQYAPCASSSDDAAVFRAVCVADQCVKQPIDQ